MLEFALLPHAPRRKIVNQVSLSLQLVTEMLLSVLRRMSHAPVPHLHSAHRNSLCAGLEGGCAGDRENYGDSRPSTCLSRCRDQAARMLLTGSQESGWFEGSSQNMDSSL